MLFNLFNCQNKKENELSLKFEGCEGYQDKTFRDDPILKEEHANITIDFPNVKVKR